MAALLLAWYAFFGYKYQFNYNWGESMTPTLSDGEWIVIQKRSSLGEKWAPQRWDVVLITDAKEGTLCKRVVALAGDKVQIRNGYIFVNDKPLGNPFRKTAPVQTSPNHDTVELTVEAGKVWVIGDNISESWYGALLIKNIKGLVMIW